MSSHPLGVQSVVFADRELSTLLDEVVEVDVDALELWGEHLSPEDHAATVAASAAALTATQIDVDGYGVVDIDDPDDVGEHLAFADRIGADYVAVSYPPMDDAITEELLVQADFHEVDVALHNTSGIHHDDTADVFSDLAEVEDVLQRNEHDRLGACLDTGHFLAEDVDPADAVAAFGDRIRAVHLKDRSEDAVEDRPGAGELDVRGLVELLDEHGAADVPLVIEYELTPERAFPALQKAALELRRILEDVDRVPPEE